jgi:hypothetical protein
MRLLRGLLVVLIAASYLACSDANAPSLEGPSFFSITLDGHPWSVDTVTGVFYHTTPDSGTLNLFAVRTRQTTVETVALTFRLPLTAAVVPLTGSLGPSTGSYIVTARSSPPPATPLTYTSAAAMPGSLRITGSSTKDTIVAGTFTFRAAANPDTAGHHTVTGQFRVRYFTQQVYTLPR